MSKKTKLMRQQGQHGSFLENLLAFLVPGVLFLAPLLVFPLRVFPFTTSKTFFLMGGIEIMVLLWVYIALKYEQYRLNKNQWLALLVPGIWIIWMTVSGIFAPNPNLAFWSSFERGTGLIFFYHCLAFLIILISLVKVRGQSFVTSIYHAVVASGVILALTTWITGNSLIGSTGHGGLMGNSSYAGAYLLFPFFFGILLLIQQGSKLKKLFVILSLFIILISPVFIDFTKMSIGEAQGATGALVVGIGVIGAIWMATRQQKITQYIGVILLGLGIVGSIAVGILFLQPSSKIHEAFVAKKTDARFIFWQIAADGIKERPIIGWGPENYSVLYHKHFNPDILSSYNTSEVWVDKPHNATLEMFVAGGIPGGIFYVIFLGMFIVLPVSLYRKRKITAGDMSVWIALAIAVNLQNLIVFDTAITYILAFTLFGCIVGKVDSEKESFSYLNEFIYPATGMVAFGFVICWIVFVHGPVTKSLGFGKIHRDSSTIISQGFPTNSSMGNGTDFGALLDTTFVKYQENISAIQSDIVQNNQAHTEIQKLLESVDQISTPAANDYRTWISAARLELFDITITHSFDTPALDRAKKYLDRATFLAPNDPQNYWVLGQWAVYSQKFSDAEHYFQQAVDINPEVLTSYQYLIAFEKQFGTPIKVLQVITKAKAQFPKENF